jgi:general secretion pathway protein G
MLNREKGFTLIEMLIVVLIIGIIVAIAIPNVLNALQRSKRSRAISDIKAIATAIASYRAAYRSDSKLTLEGIVPIADLLPSDYYNGATKDPWGENYLFTTGPNEFIIMSYGKDRSPGASTGEYDSDIIFKNGQFIAPILK